MNRRSRLLTAVTLTGAVMTTGGIEAGQPIGQGAPFSRDQAAVQARTTVNQDQLEGKWKQFKGELKQKWAEFTEDDLLAIEGRVDTLEGKIQERYGDRREEVKQWVDEWFDRHGAQKDSSES